MNDEREAWHPGRTGKVRRPVTIVPRRWWLPGLLWANVVVGFLYIAGGEHAWIKALAAVVLTLTLPAAIYFTTEM